MTDSRNDGRWRVVSTLKASWYDDEDGYDDERRAAIANRVRADDAFAAPTSLRVGDLSVATFFDLLASDDA